MHPRSRLVATVGATALLITALVPAAAPGSAHPGKHPDKHSDKHWAKTKYSLKTVTTLESARGLDALGDGRTVVSEGDGSFSLVLERRHRAAKVIPLGSVAPGVAPAVAVGKRGTVYVLTGGGPPGSGAATLYQWRHGWDEPRVLADIGAYQLTDPDPYNVEGEDTESNPFGLAVERDGSVLVADAANNDVLRVSKRGSITTLARLMPRTVEVPEGLPATDPDGNPLPPAGTEMPAEAVATSVAVGPRGEIYVGELRGFPATPGTSQVWQVSPRADGATCDPERPYSRGCSRAADGLTSIVDLAADGKGKVYAVSLSTMSWLQWELGTEGAEVGGLFVFTPKDKGKHRGHSRVEEIRPGRFALPGGVDTADGAVYVLAPTFGPSELIKLTPKTHHRKHHHKHHHRR